MMSDSVPIVKAFLELQTSYEQWNLSDEHASALERHGDADYTCLHLEWPVHAVPTKGDCIGLPSVLGPDSLVVKQVTYSRGSDNDIIVYIEAEPDPSSVTKVKYGEKTLQTLAQQGFRCVHGRTGHLKTVKRVLEQLGLFAPEKKT
jgi:hypothetical protein